MSLLSMRSVVVDAISGKPAAAAALACDDSASAATTALLSQYLTTVGKPARTATPATPKRKQVGGTTRKPAVTPKRRQAAPGSNKGVARQQEGVTEPETPAQLCMRPVKVACSLGGVTQDTDAGVWSRVARSTVSGASLAASDAPAPRVPESRRPSKASHQASPVQGGLGRALRVVDAPSCIASPSAQFSTPTLQVEQAAAWVSVGDASQGTAAVPALKTSASTESITEALGAEESAHDSAQGVHDRITAATMQRNSDAGRPHVAAPVQRSSDTRADEPLRQPAFTGAPEQLNLAPSAAIASIES